MDAILEYSSSDGAVDANASDEDEMRQRLMVTTGAKLENVTVFGEGSQLFVSSQEDVQHCLGTREEKETAQSSVESVGGQNEEESIREPEASLNANEAVTGMELAVDCNRFNGRKRRMGLAVEVPGSKFQKVEQDCHTVEMRLNKDTEKCRQPCSDGNGVSVVEKQTALNQSSIETMVVRSLPPDSEIYNSENKQADEQEESHEHSNGALDKANPDHRNVKKLADTNNQTEGCNGPIGVDFGVLLDRKKESLQAFPYSSGIGPGKEDSSEAGVLPFPVSGVSIKQGDTYEMDIAAVSAPENRRDWQSEHGKSVNYMEHSDSIAFERQLSTYDCSRWHYDYTKQQLWFFYPHTSAYHVYTGDMCEEMGSHSQDAKSLMGLSVKKIESVREENGCIHALFTDDSILEDISLEEADCIKKCSEMLSQDVYRNLLDEPFDYEKIKSLCLEQESACPSSSSGPEGFDTCPSKTVEPSVNILGGDGSQTETERALIFAAPKDSGLGSGSGSGQNQLLPGSVISIQESNNGWYFHPVEHRWYYWDGCSWVLYSSSNDGKTLPETPSGTPGLPGCNSRNESGREICKDSGNSEIYVVDESKKHPLPVNSVVEELEEGAGLKGEPGIGKEETLHRRQNWVEDTLIENFLQPGKNHIKHQKYGSNPFGSFNNGSMYGTVPGAEAWAAALRQENENENAVGEPIPSQKMKVDVCQEIPSRLPGQYMYYGAVYASLCNQGTAASSQGELQKEGQSDQSSVLLEAGKIGTKVESPDEELEEGEIADEPEEIANHNSETHSGEIQPSVNQSGQPDDEAFVDRKLQGGWKWESSRWVWIDKAGHRFLPNMVGRSQTNGHETLDVQQTIEGHKEEWRTIYGSLENRVSCDTFDGTHNAGAIQDSCGEPPSTFDSGSYQMSRDVTSGIPNVNGSDVQGGNPIPEPRKMTEWLSQFEGGVASLSSPTVVSDKAKTLGATDLWDWGVATKGSNNKKGWSLTGRVAPVARMLHPSLGASGGLIKTGTVKEAEGDLVRVSTGKVYRLRKPSDSYLAALAVNNATYNVLNPTQSWGLPPLLNEDGKVYGEVVKKDMGPILEKPFILNPGLQKDQLLAISKRLNGTVSSGSTKDKKSSLPSGPVKVFSKSSCHKSSRSDEKSARVSSKEGRSSSSEMNYRDRAAERRSLHGTSSVSEHRTTERRKQEKTERDSTRDSKRDLTRDLLRDSSRGSIRVSRDSSKDVARGGSVKDKKLSDDNKGKQVLHNMGWREGQQLGSSGGLKDPVEANGNKGRAGIGWKWKCTLNSTAPHANLKWDRCARRKVDLSG